MRRMTTTPTPADHELCISIPRAAQRLGISRTHAYELALQGKIPSIMLGRRRVVPVGPLEQFVADATNGMTGT